MRTDVPLPVKVAGHERDTVVADSGYLKAHIAQLRKWQRALNLVPDREGAKVLRIVSPEYAQCDGCNVGAHDMHRHDPGILSLCFLDDVLCRQVQPGFPVYQKSRAKRHTRTFISELGDRVVVVTKQSASAFL